MERTWDPEGDHGFPGDPTTWQRFDLDTRRAGKLVVEGVRGRLARVRANLVRRSWYPTPFRRRKRS